MTPDIAASAPWETLILCLLLFIAPTVAVQHRPAWPFLIALAASIGASLLVNDGVIAYGILAAGALVHAWYASRWSRTGAAMLVVAAVLTAAAAVFLSQQQLTAAFLLSAAAIGLRAGVLPLHGGAASLCDRAPATQTRQMSSLIALVFVHLRYVDHGPGVAVYAPWLVNYGAIAALLAAIMTLVQRDLRGFYRGTTAMHGGFLISVLGAASVGNFGAALLVVASVGLALGGLGMMITSLEERVGPVEFSVRGGRAGAFPVLAGSFAFFAGAGIAMPGTAGFVADDLMLHTLWLQSPTATVCVILSSALLSVSSLIAYAQTFLGRMVPSRAPDLYVRERSVVALLLAALVALGLAPWLLLGPADAFLNATLPIG